MKKPGYTLVELMLVLSIIIVLASISFPYWGQLVRFQTTVFTGGEVKAQIYYSRSYSINRNSKCFIEVLNDLDSLKYYYGTNSSNKAPIPIANGTAQLIFDGTRSGLDINPSSSGTQTLEFSKHGKPAADYQIAFNDIYIKIDGKTGRVYVE